MFKKIWFCIQLTGAAIFLALLYIFGRDKKTIQALDDIQERKEKEAKEQYEKMSDDDVVDSLVNANDIRNTAREGGANVARTLFRDRARSILSRLVSKGVLREDIPSSGQIDRNGLQTRGHKGSGDSS